MNKKVLGISALPSLTESCRLHTRTNWIMEVVILGGFFCSSHKQLDVLTGTISIILFPSSSAEKLTVKTQS